MSVPAYLYAGAQAAGALGDIYSQIMGNRMSDKQFAKQLSWQQKQYYDSRDWNSAPNQVRLLRQAGLNPALALGAGVVGGTATPVGSPSPTSSYQSTSLAEGIGRIASGYEALQNADTQESVRNANNAAASNSQEQSITESQKRAYYLGSLDLDNKIKRQAYVLTQETMMDKIRQAHYEAQYSLLKSQNQELLNKAQEISNGFLPKQIEEQINNLVADTKYKIISGNASTLQARAAMKQAEAAIKHLFYANGVYVGEERMDEFRDLMYDSLDQSIATSTSEEYRNTFFPWSSNIGGKVIGVSHSTVQGRQGQYEVFKQSRQYERYRKRQGNK